MVESETNKFIKILYSLLLTNYQINMSENLKGNDSVFDYIDRLYYRCHKITLNRGRYYIDSPDYLKNKKYINPTIKLISVSGRQ